MTPHGRPTSSRWPFFTGLVSGTRPMLMEQSDEESKGREASTLGERLVHLHGGKDGGANRDGGPRGGSAGLPTRASGAAWRARPDRGAGGDAQGLPGTGSGPA